MKQKIILGLLTITLCACTGALEKETIDEYEVEDSSIGMVQEEEKGGSKRFKISTEKDFVEALKFSDGKTVSADGPENIYYFLPDTNKIQGINLRNFYSIASNDQDKLYQKIEEIASATQATEVLAEDLPQVAKDHNQLHESGSGNESGLFSFLQSINLSKVNKKDISKVAYALSLAGEYDASRDLINRVCSDSTDCMTWGKVIVRGKVMSDSKPLSGALITLLNDPNHKAQSKKNGKFEFEFETFFPNKLRFSVSKPGFAKVFQQAYLVMEHPPKQGHSINIDFILMPANGAAKLGENASGKGVNVKKIEDGGYRLTLPKRKAVFDVKKFINREGKEVSDEGLAADIFFFPVDQSDSIAENLLNIDVAGDGISVLGNEFITYGMPFISVRNQEGQEVFVSKKTPASVEFDWRDRILVDSGNDIRSSFTDDQWEKLINFSLNSEEEFPLTAESITELFGGIDPIKGGYPIWWQLNLKKGVWEPSPFEILDKEGRRARGVVYQVD